MNYELVKILKDGEKFISGEEMIKRAKEIGITSGKEDVDYLIEHQEEIPEEWRDYYLIFPNYILLNVDRDRRIFFVYCNYHNFSLVNCFIYNLYS